jgi:hypothetical protein
MELATAWYLFSVQPKFRDRQKRVDYLLRAKFFSSLLLRSKVDLRIICKLIIVSKNTL